MFLDKIAGPLMYLISQCHEYNVKVYTYTGGHQLPRFLCLLFVFYTLKITQSKSSLFALEKATCYKRKHFCKGGVCCVRWEAARGKLMATEGAGLFVGAGGMGEGQDRE